VPAKVSKGAKKISSKMMMVGARNLAVVQKKERTACQKSKASSSMQAAKKKG
jgi:hypothetical protein